MRGLTSVLCFIVIAVVNASSLAATNDEYWISYSGGQRDPLPSGPKYLMKINAAGEVLAPPRKVLNVDGAAGATAISHRDGSTINLWFVGTRRIEPPGYPTEYPIFRCVIDKASLKVLSIVRTPLGTNDFTRIQVTQREANNFLAVPMKRPPDFRTSFVGVGLLKSGGVGESRWRLYRNTADCEECGNGVSADGRVFFFTDLLPGDFVNKQNFILSRPFFTKERFMIQRLGQNGRPIGDTFPAHTGQALYAFDVSGLLHVNKRLVLYSEFVGRLFVQMVDVKNAKIGERAEIGLSGSPWQSAAIDPLGRFVVYIGIWPRIGAESDRLIFRALDTNGRPKGIPKILATGASAGLDILRN